MCSVYALAQMSKASLKNIKCMTSCSVCLVPAAKQPAHKYTPGRNSNFRGKKVALFKFRSHLMPDQLHKFGMRFLTSRATHPFNSCMSTSSEAKAGRSSLLQSDYRSHLGRTNGVLIQSSVKGDRLGEVKHLNVKTNDHIMTFQHHWSILA